MARHVKMACSATVPSPATAAPAPLPPAGSIPGIRIPAGQTFTFTAPVVGSLNVIDVDAGVVAGTDSVLELDGGGDASSMLVMRIAGRMKLQLRSTLVLSGGLAPEHTLLYVKGGGCQISDLTLGAGTVLCSPARVRIGRSAAWAGAVFADGRLMRIGDKSTFRYMPFRGF
jgi:hypothetical protein